MTREMKVRFRNNQERKFLLCKSDRNRYVLHVSKYGFWLKKLDGTIIIDASMFVSPLRAKSGRIIIRHGTPAPGKRWSHTQEINLAGKSQDVFKLRR